MAGKISEMLSESLIHIISGDQLDNAYEEIKQMLGDDFEEEFYDCLEPLAVNKALWNLQRKHGLHIF